MCQLSLLLDPSSINALTIITLLFEPALIEVFCDRCSMMQKARERRSLGRNCAGNS
ncbi:hypothetical protein H6G93_25020 [Nostoc sp. FACHB-973]|nr:hypothetical protein [Nostoc sp. FACHB-973]